MRPNIGSFNCMKSPVQGSDGIPGENSTQSPSCQGSGPFNHKEGGDRTLNEISYERGTRILLQNSSGTFNHLNRQARGIIASGIRYPPHLATIGLDGLNESSRISNETLGKIRRIRRIKSSWTKSKIGGSRPRDNSDSLNDAESPSHEPDAASSNSRASSPATVGHNFMDYLIANYSHGIFDPHRNRLAPRLSPDAKQSPDLPSNQSALFSSSYNPKAPKPITAEEIIAPYHCSDQRTCIARELLQSNIEAKPIHGRSAKMSDRYGVKKTKNRKLPVGEQACKTTNASRHDTIKGL